MFNALRIPRSDRPAAGRVETPATAVPLETLASAVASPRHRLLAVGLCAAAAAATAILLPSAAHPVAPIPGFLALNQATLALVYGMTAWLFLSQYASTRASSLLILGSGSLFTTLMVVLQLGCFPNMLAPGLILGQGAATLTWLWNFWHLGPPLFALAYALSARGVPPAPRRGSTAVALWTSCAGIVAAATGIAFLTIRDVQILPRVVGPGDGYVLLTTSGIGPALIVFTVLALAVLCWTTRLRTVLQVWLAASLFLLILDNVITDVGAARATVGWVFGRIEAVLAALVILGMYLRELNTLFRRTAEALQARDAALREASSARDNLEIALEASGMGDWELDLATDRFRQTLRQDRIFGYDALQADWDFARFLDHVVPDDRALVRDAFAAAQGGASLDVDCRITRAGDGAIRWIGIWGKVSFDAAGRPATMAGCVVDATDKRLDDQRLREAERMEAIGQLTGGVAHDFNNLLTVIMGSLDMIQRRPEDAPRVRRLAQNAFAAGRRGSELTERLLSFSRRQVVNPKTVNLNRLLGEFRPLLGRAIGETIVITLDLDAHLDPARVDVGQFQAAILNLAGNARDAMPAGGTLTLKTRNLVLPDEAIDGMSDLPAGDYLQVVVSDTGIGMDAATAARAFDPFFTTKDVGYGTGLGLSQVYGFARQAGGRCRVVTEPGQGCAIELFLPRSTDEVSGQAERVGSLPMRRASGQEVVLVVEDEDAVREMAAESLESLGYQVLTAPDARVALGLLQARERIDILFSDVVMPGGMNGAQLALEARTIRPDLKVLLTSGYTATASVGARELPLDVPLLRKPYLREELATTLEAVLKVAAS